jgi:hypothetical protein
MYFMDRPFIDGRYVRSDGPVKASILATLHSQFGADVVEPIYGQTE